MILSRGGGLKGDDQDRVGGPHPEGGVETGVMIGVDLKVPMLQASTSESAGSH